MVQKKKQLFILEQNSMPPQSVSEESIAVIIYLYYLDTIKNYITYIEKANYKCNIIKSGRISKKIGGGNIGTKEKL